MEMGTVSSLLSNLPKGQEAIVAKFVDLPIFEIDRLRQLGLFRGAVVEVLESNSAGPLLVRIGDGRIAVNRGIADQIKVIGR